VDELPRGTANAKAHLGAEAELELQRVRVARRELMGEVSRAPDTFADVASRLLRLERYERRALSKRNRFLRTYDAEHSTEECRCDPSDARQ
jgi:hypothetical protein